MNLISFYCIWTENCEDDPNWRKEILRDRLDNCSTLTHDLCNNWGRASWEARQACPKACGVCKCLCSVPSEHKDALPRGKSCFDSVNDVNSNGRTALHVAARYDEHECVKTLLTVGSEREARDSDQKTPIQLALWKYYLDKYEFGCESVKILINVGQDFAQTETDHLKRAEKSLIRKCMEDDSY